MTPLQFLMKIFGILLTIASIPGYIFFFIFLDKYIRPYTDPFVNKFIHPMLDNILRYIFGIY